MPTNDFIPYATGGGANVESQAAYVADPTTAGGQLTGTAGSSIFNKIWRQGNFVASCVAQLISTTLTVDTLDDGDQAGFITKLSNMIKNLAWTSPTLTGTAAAPTVAGTTDNTTKISTTAFVQAVRALLAPLASPALTGTPTAPTPAATDLSTKLATTQWVFNYLNSLIFSGTFTGLAASGTNSTAHGLTGSIISLQGFLVCLSADNGYVVGDKIAVPATNDTTTNRGVEMWFTNTLVGYGIGSGGVSSVPKTGGAVIALDLTKWSLFVAVKGY